VVSSSPTAPRPWVAENFFICADSRGFAVVCLSRPGRPCPLLFLCALAALREILGTIWAGTPTLLEKQGPTGASALPGAVFIRVDSRHSRLSVFHGRDGRAPFFDLGRFGETTLPFFRWALTEQRPPVFLCAFAPVREILLASKKSLDCIFMQYTIPA